eukprot:TRINITY_DN9846_c0_g1_i3.p1 TRINITY_DN9846_c0_g1~~TRINITY_DN9846_c0_g1_i3.p1  ORF type:complete len:163 (+),score=27.84 TRINITY_DN9846_c0_g1_i3:65-553(+)
MCIRDSGYLIWKILKFYGREFNSLDTGISLMEYRPYFKKYHNAGETSSLVVLDHLSSAKNITQNAYLIDDIIKEFDEAFTAIERFQDSIMDHLVTMDLEEGISCKEVLERFSSNESLQKLWSTDLLRRILYKSQRELALARVKSISTKHMCVVYKLDTFRNE